MPATAADAAGREVGRLPHVIRLQLVACEVRPALFLLYTGRSAHAPFRNAAASMVGIGGCAAGRRPGGAVAVRRLRRLPQSPLSPPCTLLSCSFVRLHQQMPGRLIHSCTYRSSAAFHSLLPLDAQLFSRVTHGRCHHTLIPIIV